MVDLAFLDSFDLPDAGRPGEPVTGKVILRNEYGFVSPVDENYCVVDEGGIWFSTAGLRMYIEIEITSGPNSGQIVQTTPEFCMPQDTVVKNVTFELPQTEGEYQFAATAWFAGTGEIVGGQLDTITVSADAPPTGDCFDDSDCPDGQTCENGNCVGGTDEEPETDAICDVPILGTILCGESGDTVGDTLSRLELLIALVALAIIIKSVADILD